MKKLQIAALAGLLLSGTSQVAKAVTVVYSTDFNSPTYADGGLIGQDSWVITGTSTVSPISVANTATNGTVSLTTTGQDVRRALGTSITSGSIYLQFDLTVASAQTTGDYFIHLGDNGSSNFYARTYVKSTGTGTFAIAVGTSAGAATYGTNLTIGTTYTVLVRYDIVSGLANDTGAVFINPTTSDGSADTAYIGVTTVGTDPSQISSVSLRQGTASSAPTVTVDNISVSVVPEPGISLISAIGFIGLLRRRR
jgi:hypothetical protein